VAASRVHLEAASQREVRFFAYPYGQLDDFDAAAEAEVERSGYVAACSSHFGRSSSEAERFRIRRVGIEAGDGLGVVERKLDGAYDWVSYKERIGARWRNGPLANPRTGTLS
jgi:hypothetical protein